MSAADLPPDFSRQLSVHRRPSQRGRPGPDPDGGQRRKGVRFGRVEQTRDFDRITARCAASVMKSATPLPYTWARDLT